MPIDDIIIDSREFNPAFFRELKVICKKELGFALTYENYVKKFLRLLFETDVLAANARDEFSNYVSEVIEIASPKDPYRIYKFRARLADKGKSQSPRVFVATISGLCVIPLGIYTHGDRHGELGFKDCVKRLEKVLERLQV
jgi:hypothetical protein